MSLNTLKDDKSEGHSIIPLLAALWVLSMIFVLASGYENTVVAESREKKINNVRQYLVKNECWAISFIREKGQKKVAYFCYKHPKNPATSDVYVVERDPNRPQSGISPQQLDQIYDDMYTYGKENRYVLPKPRNDVDRAKLPKPKEDNEKGKPVILS